MTNLVDELREIAITYEEQFGPGPRATIERAAALLVQLQAEPKAPTGCPIHGPCPVCRAMTVLGDPRVGVQLAGPDVGTTFMVGAHAAAAPQAGVFAWVCTKHGNIPFQDCSQCAQEKLSGSA